jgi:hypothetical protein
MVFDPFCQRYSKRAFPPYRYVPGRFPHPRHNPNGHSFGQPIPTVSRADVALWHRSEEYRYGIDLFNFGYWWESHEQFEALWRVSGPLCPEGRFFQGLVQVAAAYVKRRMENASAATTLFHKATRNLKLAPAHCMGLNVGALIEAIEKSSATPDEPAIVLRLNCPDESAADQRAKTSS